jgi:hypothetical protein
MTNWIQFGSLIVAGVTLVYLIKYAGYTKVIAEATSKPAIIATRTGVITNPPRLRNIGNGPALDVEWSVSGTKIAGRISYIEPGTESDPLDVNLSTLEHGAVMSGTDKVTISCSYRSLTRRKARSVSEYDFVRGVFWGSTFTD